MRPLRVLWLTDSLALGGAEALVVAFAKGLDPTRVDLHVAYLKSIGGNPFEEELRSLGVPVTGLEARNLRDLGGFRRLLRLLRREGVDLIHAHLAYASMWGAAAGALTRIPVVATFHVAPPPDPPWTREGMRRALRVRLVNGFAHRAVAVSRAVASAWIREGLDPDKTEVVHNGVPVERFARVGGTPAAVELRRQLAAPAGTPLLVSVCVLREGKGLGDLLTAMETLGSKGKGAVLAMAGDGPLRSDLERQIRERGLEHRVCLLGLRRDVPDLLGAADLFVLPSHWDAFPTAILEAMAAGLPVVATRAGGIPEMVEDGATGLLVAPGHAGELSDALGLLLDRPALAQRLGRAGRERAVERFSLAGWRDRLCSLYEGLAGIGKEAA